MRAVRFHAAHDIRIEDVPEPGALGPYEVLLAPSLVGICGTDLHEYLAGPIVTPTEPHPLTGATNPQILGHELSAEVVEVGEAVRTVRPGERVSVMPLAYCGQCHPCVRGLNHLCERMGCVGLSWAWGGLGERAVVLEHQVAVLPDSVSDEQGALIEPAAVALYGVEKGGVRPGDRVLIAGAGPIGALAVLAARAAGAGEVYLSEPNAVRAERAAPLQADLVLDPTSDDVAAVLRERTGVGVDVAIECAGNAHALDDCIRATRRAGTIVQTGLHVAPATVHPMLWAERELTIVGTWCYPVYDWPRIVSLVASGAFPVERVVTSRIGVDDAVTGGFDVLVDPSGSEIKVLVEVGGA